MDIKKRGFITLIFSLGVALAGACSEDGGSLDRGLVFDARAQPDTSIDGQGDSARHDLTLDVKRDTSPKPSDVGTPDVSTPDVSTPDVSTPDVGTPDVGTPDVGTPDVGTPDAPKIVVLGNGVCHAATIIPIAPGAGEDGHLAASRLTPKHYPFTVTQVRYALLPGSSLKCHTGMSHRVELYVRKNVAPAASPTVRRAIKVSASSPGTTIRVITLDVTPPLKLSQGEELFVAVEMRIDATGHKTCLRSCSSSTSASNRDYWSNAASAPYPWKTLAALGIPAFYSTQALGY